MVPKFRAWDKKKNEMFNVIAINMKLKRVYETWNEDGTNLFAPLDSTILMQSTGLHDKNGKEIFEGDILHHPLQGMRKVYYPFLDTVASYGLENIENGMRNTLEDAHRVYEVIGNIYQHSHLLGNGGENL